MGSCRSFPKSSPYRIPCFSTHPIHRNTRSPRYMSSRHFPRSTASWHPSPSPYESNNRTGLWNCYRIYSSCLDKEPHSPRLPCSKSNHTASDSNKNPCTPPHTRTCLFPRYKQLAGNHVKLPIGAGVPGVPR